MNTTNAAEEQGSQEILSPKTLQMLRSVRSPRDQVTLFQKVSRLFLSKSAEDLANLENAVNRNDPGEFYRRAHSFKSSCANVGAIKLAEILRALEEKGRQGQTDGAAQMLSQAKSLYLLVREALEKELELPS